jgi:hypothetical protein
MALLHLSRRFAPLPTSGAGGELDEAACDKGHNADAVDGESQHGDSPPHEGWNRLGDWWAMHLPLRPARFVLAVCEHGRLPLVVHAEPAQSLLQRLPDALYEQLLGIKVPADLARRERAAMQPLEPVHGDADGNGMLGVLKAYAIDLQAAWDTGMTRSAAELGAHLAAQPNEHLAGATPAQATRRRFHLLPDQTEALGL